MKIENMKDLKALIQLCQRTGVEAITIDGIDIKLGQAPQPKARRSKEKEVMENPTTGADTRTWDDLSEDEKMFYSAQQVMIKEN